MIPIQMEQSYNLQWKRPLFKVTHVIELTTRKPIYVGVCSENTMGHSRLLEIPIGEIPDGCSDTRLLYEYLSSDKVQKWLTEIYKGYEVETMGFPEPPMGSLTKPALERVQKITEEIAEIAKDLPLVTPLSEKTPGIPAGVAFKIHAFARNTVKELGEKGILIDIKELEEKLQDTACWWMLFPGPLDLRNLFESFMAHKDESRSITEAVSEADLFKQKLDLWMAEKYPEFTHLLRTRTRTDRYGEDIFINIALQEGDGIYYSILDGVFNKHYPGKISTSDGLKIRYAKADTRMRQVKKKIQETLHEKFSTKE